MKSSCVVRVENDPIVIIRKSYVDFASSNHCAAALIAFFEFWHNIKIAQSEKAAIENQVAEKHGDAPTQNTSLWQFHTTAELEAGLNGLYSKRAINPAIDLLVELGVLEVGSNPNPRYAFDRTRFFLFHPEPLNDFLLGGRHPARTPDADESPDTNKSADAPEQKSAPSAQKSAPSAQMVRTIPENTTEYSSVVSPDDDRRAPAGETKRPEQQPGTEPRTRGKLVNDPATAQLAALLESHGIMLSSFLYDEYMELVERYGYPAVQRGLAAAAQNNRAGSIKYVSACVRTAAGGSNNANTRNQAARAAASQPAKDWHDLPDQELYRAINGID